MNPIQYALRQVARRIPPPILKAMFVDTINRNHTWGRVHAPTLSVDHQIRDKVIEQGVLIDINLISGQRDLIKISGLPVTGQGQGDFSQVIHVPKDRTNGRSIIAVYHIVIGSSTGAMGAAFNVAYDGAASTLGEAAKAVQQSRSPIPVVSDGNLSLIAENTIAVRTPIRQTGPAWLDCLLEHNSQLSNVVPGAYRNFADLVVACTKAYIYNNIIIPMDEAELVGGMALGQFKSIIDSYADAEELYQEQLHIWENVSIMSDPVQHLDLIQSQMGGLF